MMARPPKVSTPSEPAASLPEAIFGDAVALERQETGVTRAPGRCFFASGAYCGSVLNLSADWRALRPLEENLTLVVQLVSAAPGATDLRLNYNYWPGRGNLPTSTWPTGLVIVDTYALPLPPSDMETQAWKVTLAYLNPTDGSRLPVTAHGEAVGDSLTLGLVRVPGRQPEATDLEALAPPVTFSTNGTADALHLVGAQALAQGNGTWTVDLLWECTNTVDVDVVTFVHAYDAASQLLTAGDGPPRGGTFPTSLWEPGDRIRSQHVLTLAPPTPPHTIAVGLYLPDTGVRLRATRDGAPLPDDAHVIWRQAP